jgi:hypothetical protein
MRGLERYFGEGRLAPRTVVDLALTVPEGKDLEESCVARID